MQRQIQKGALATMTMDRLQTKQNGKGNEGDCLSAEEVRDCFTLKDTANSDTKAKIGKDWPDYSGRRSLISQNCNDTVLLGVVARKSSVEATESGTEPLISYVYIVKEEPSDKDGCNDYEDDAIHMKKDKSDVTDDDDFDDNISNQSYSKSDSDEEYEFK